MGKWAGLNKRADNTDLEDGESPDCSNAFLAKDTVGMLGQRKGKTFFNSTAYTDVVQGIVPFVTTAGAKKLLIADNAGGITDNAAPLTTVSTSGGISPSVPTAYYVTAPITENDAWLVGHTGAYSAFLTPIPAFTSKHIFVPRDFTIVTAPNDLTLSYGITCRVRLLDSGLSQIGSDYNLVAYTGMKDVFTLGSDPGSFMKFGPITTSVAAAYLQIYMNTDSYGGATLTSTAGPFSYIVVA